jgi:GxxExxY protein
MLHAEITGDIIQSFYQVYNTLGYGFLEKVYENALAIELSKRCRMVKQQTPIMVLYEGQIVGNYFADMLVDDKVIIELKAADQISEEHEAQLVNYLKATGFKVGLLLNFGKEAKFKRKVFSGQRSQTKPPQTTPLNFEE